MAIHTFDEEYYKQGGEPVKIMNISVDPIRGCTCTMSPVQRPMSVYCLTWGSWRRSKASCKRWTNAVERMTPLKESIGSTEICHEQTCAKVLSDKEGDGGDVEIAKPFRDCGECDSCGVLRSDTGRQTQVGEKRTEEREAENQYHDCESGGYICCPTLCWMEGSGYAMDGTIGEG